MTQKEISKSEQINKKNNLNETTKEFKNRLSNIAFSQVLSYSNSMIEFKINKEDIIRVVDIFVKKYEIEPALAETIYENIKNSKKDEEEDAEIEKYFMELEEKYELNKENEKNEENEKERPRAQTIHSNNKDNTEKKIDYSNRSKSLKEKSTPIINLNNGGGNENESNNLLPENKTKNHIT